MGIPSRTNPPRRSSRPLWAALILLSGCLLTLAAQTPTQATTVPLLLPGGLAYDAQGNLYFAETANHLICRISPTGILSVVAGTGVQGYAGDGGPATSALLDSPQAVALDAAGDLFVADTHNHRIRRVDAATGIITTFWSAQIGLPSSLALDASGNLYFADSATHLVRRISAGAGSVSKIAGNGTQGFSGDGGLATAASIDSPSGLALDSIGNLFLADTHNHRIRRVDAVTGVITTVAGTGQPGFYGDASPATFARIDLPHGLGMDSSGNLFLADSSNQRIRRIDAVTGQITTIAGDGTQAFAGDGGPAASAALNTPRAIALSPASLPALSDSANGRIRQVDTAADIHTMAGLGATGSVTLTVSAASVILYGTGSVTATLAASPATGSVTFFDMAGTAAQPVTLATIPLAANLAADPITTLAAGAHHVSATYPGDATHSPAESGTLAFSVSPAPASASPNSVSLLYGQAIPALTGTLTGVLPQDSSLVALALTASATPLSPPAAYPINASLTGPSAGNYALTASPAAVTIAKAPASATLSVALAVHVAAATAGQPTGSVTLLDGANIYATATLNATGDATFSAANLSSGSHTLTASYAGDADFLSTTSAPILLAIGAAATPDFALAATSSGAVTVTGGNAASFSFLSTPLNGALSSPVLLTASGLPAGAVATFNPASIVPAATPTAFTLTITTVKVARLTPTIPAQPLWFLAALIPFALVRKRRRAILLFLAAAAIGCGNRVNETSAIATAARTYNITVIGTATSASGATLQHSTSVTLTVQ